MSTAIWTMGNLVRFAYSVHLRIINSLLQGRAGYGATTEGMWPYTYDTCDLGTYPNQTTSSGQPASAATGGTGGGPLSYLPGQRLSACTCPGSDHPGPNVNVGRGVPEVDIFEAQVDIATGQGQVSQSCQIAPYNYGYNFVNGAPATTIYNPAQTSLNTYIGGVFQQALSAVTNVDSANYDGQGYAPYGFELWSDPNNRQDGYITWYSNGAKSWTVTSASMGPDTVSEVQQRLISEEPMVSQLRFFVFFFSLNCIVSIS
jgi:beta-glucan synthesis-associated protein KRE6